MIASISDSKKSIGDHVLTAFDPTEETGRAGPPPPRKDTSKIQAAWDGLDKLKMDALGTRLDTLGIDPEGSNKKAWNDETSDEEVLDKEDSDDEDSD